MKRSKRAALSAAACISALVMSGLPGVPAPAAAQTSAPTTSTPSSTPARDGSGSPDPSTTPTTAVPYEPPPSTTPKGFDDRLSKVVPAETTPTKLVHVNADGSKTARIDTAPVRFQDSAGRWARPIPCRRSSTTSGRP